MRRTVLWVIFSAGLWAVGWAGSAAPGQNKKEKKPDSGDLPTAASSDVDLLKRTVAGRKEYEESLR